MRISSTACGLALALALGGFAMPAHAQHHDHGEGHDHGAKAPVREEPLRAQIPDTVLIDQDGKPHRFYSDLVKGKLVLMNGIYTTCQGSCSMQTAVFRQVQKLMGDRVGRDVQLISVSLDPVTDTPERLKAFAAKFEPQPGWTFLTGPKADVAHVLRAMDLYAPVPEEHTPIAAVGNEPASLWMKVINLSSPVDLVHRIEHLEKLGSDDSSSP